MAAIKITTPIKHTFFLLCAALCTCFSVLNFGDFLHPIAQQKQQIVDRLGEVDAAVLRDKQTALLAQEPADPYAWALLVHLTLLTRNDESRAFAALKMADTVSPHERRQMLERATMWDDLKAVHSDEDRARQLTLWEDAYRYSKKRTNATMQQRGYDQELKKIMDVQGR